MFCVTSCLNRPYKAEQKSIKKERSLVALGQLWGFLKYHHPAVANGNYDWDMELIKIIPLVREAEDDSIWKKLLDSWLDSLPPILENPGKKLPDLEIKLKPDYGELFNDEYFLPETIEKIRYILDNAVILTNHYVRVDMNPYARPTIITNEFSYKDLLYPELSYRLLALFRYWNIVNYFFPYRELCDQKWSTVLADMLPEFINAKNQEEYIFACLKLATKIDDSHGSLNPNLNMGLLNVPFAVQFIENQLVVTMFTGNDDYVKEKIEIGDIITSIDGEPVDAIVNRMLPYTPASNYPVKLRQISSYILTGNASSVNIVVQRDGKTFKIKIPRYDQRLLNTPNYYSDPQPDKEGFRILDSSIGYVLPSNSKDEDVKKGIGKVLDGTKGVIVDFRCYPNNFDVSYFLSHLDLIEKDRFFPEILSNANVSYPGYFFTRKNIRPRIVPQKSYSQKIVVIVNEYTQSQAEEVVMYFQTASNVIVIGSTTAGADGWIINFSLPGNIITRITGVGEYYPDGGETQRVGIRIDEFMKPTIAGIKTGRDELLERAIEIINESYQVYEQ